MTQSDRSKASRHAGLLFGAVAVALSSMPLQVIADDAGAFIGGMVASRVLNNIRESAEASGGGGSSSVESRLNTLDKLLADGHITKREYDERKKAILDSI